MTESIRYCFFYILYAAIYDNVCTITFTLPVKLTVEATKYTRKGFFELDSKVFY